MPLLKVVGTTENRVVSVKAICRRTHPRLGETSPTWFIPLVEEAGLMGLLGEWVLAQACRAASGLPTDVLVAVNVSSLQISGGHFETVVAKVLAETGLSARRLELELTEKAYPGATQRTQRVMQALRANGSRLVLDDFGTGYFSLS